MEQYWRPRLARAPAHAFEIDALTTDPEAVTLDYLGYDGFPVRTHFRFTSTGIISLTACMPIRAAAEVVGPPLPAALLFGLGPIALATLAFEHTNRHSRPRVHHLPDDPWLSAALARRFV